jgi:hypothetical protein
MGSIRDSDLSISTSSSFQLPKSPYGKPNDSIVPSSPLIGKGIGHVVCKKKKKKKTPKMRRKDLLTPIIEPPPPPPMEERTYRKKSKSISQVKIANPPFQKQKSNSKTRTPDHLAAAIELSTTNTVSAPAPAAGMYWSRTLTYGRGPSRPLRAHSANLVGERLYVFGGCDTSMCFSTLYVLDMGRYYFLIIGLLFYMGKRGEKILRVFL